MFCFRVIYYAFSNSLGIAQIVDVRRNLYAVSLKEHENLTKAGPGHGSFEITPRLAICKFISKANSKMTHERTK